MAHEVTLIPGDGIGPEVCAAAVHCLEASGAELRWERAAAGLTALKALGDPLPERALGSIERTGVALKGPTATPVGAGFRSVNLALRERFDLYAGVRPCRAPGAGEPGADLDLTIVRMNTEDLYAGIELEAGEPGAAELRVLVRERTGGELPADAGVSLRPISASGARRVAERAMAIARERGLDSVTVAHKATVMRATDGLFLAEARAAGKRAGVEVADRLVDTVCHDLIRRPERHRLILCPMMYGDLLSDLGAALIGGLGMAPGANLGDRVAIFEPVHGTAPPHAGRGTASPIAMIRCGAMLLRHLGERDAAQRLEAALDRALAAITGPADSPGAATADAPASAKAAATLSERLAAAVVIELG